MRKGKKKSRQWKVEGKEKKNRTNNDSTGNWKAKTQSGGTRLYKEWL